MSKKVVELIFCVSSSGNFSRTFRVFVSGSGESTKDIAGTLRENSKSIVMSHQGIINDDDVEAAAVGIELISNFFGPEWYLNELEPEASGGFAKVNTGPGSTLDVYKFMHDLYEPTVG